LKSAQPILRPCFRFRRRSGHRSSPHLQRRTHVEIPAGAIVVQRSDPVEGCARGRSGRQPLSAEAAIGGGVHYSASRPATSQREMRRRRFARQSGTITSWVFLTGVDVLAPAAAGSIIAFGDSITDGARSTADTTTAGRTFWRRVCWPANPGWRWSIWDWRQSNSARRRLLEAPAIGINALARFDQDVLSQPGVAI